MHAGVLGHKDGIENMRKRKSNAGAPPHARSANLIFRGKKLTILREKLGRSRVQMDADLGETDGTYARWERAAPGRELTDKKVTVVCNKYDLDEIVFSDTVSSEEFDLLTDKLKPNIDKKNEISAESLNHKNISDKYIPNNLPKETSTFIGRTNELAQLLDFFSPNSRAVCCAITGVGCVGKSALAVEAAKRSIERGFFDAIVFYSAKRECFFDNKISPKRHVKADIDEFLSTIIEVVYPGNIHIPLPVSEKLKIVMNFLSRNNTLIIIDNFETIEDDDVMVFIKEMQPSSKVLITARKSVSLEKTIQLLELSRDETREMILEKCSLQNISIGDDEVDLIATHIEGIPLAVEWVVGQITSHFWNTEKFLRHLKSKEDSPLLEFIFNESWKCISTTSKSVLISLAAVPLPLSGSILTATHGINVGEGNDSLIELLRYSLIKIIKKVDPEFPKLRQMICAEDSYSLLPLTKSFIRKHNGYNAEQFLKKASKYFMSMLSIDGNLCDGLPKSTVNTIIENQYLLIFLIKELFLIEDYQSVLSLSKHLDFLLKFKSFHDTFCNVASAIRTDCEVSEHSLCICELAIQAAVNMDDEVEHERYLLLGSRYIYSLCCEIDNWIELIEMGLPVFRPETELSEVAIKGIRMMMSGLRELNNRNYTKAEKLLAAANRHYNKIDDAQHFATTYGFLLSIAQIQGDYKLALSYCNEFIKRVIDWGRGKDPEDCLAFPREILLACYHRKSLLLRKLNDFVGIDENHKNILALNQDLKCNNDTTYVYIFPQLFITSAAFYLISNSISRLGFCQHPSNMIGRHQKLAVLFCGPMPLGPENLL